MTQNVPQKILDRIKKCLALAADGSNESEAATALRQARKLMDMYGVTSTDIELSEIVMHERVVNTNLFTHWQNQLIETVKNIFGIEVLYRRRGNRKRGSIIFVGPQSSIELAEYLYEVLHSQLHHDRDEYRDRILAQPLYAELRDLCNSAGIRWSSTKAAKRVADEVDAFTMAWVMKVHERCESLFVARSQTLETFFSRNLPDINPLKLKKFDAEEFAGHGRAISEGLTKGSKAQIHIGVRAGERQAALTADDVNS